MSTNIPCGDPPIPQYSVGGAGVPNGEVKTTWLHPEEDLGIKKERDEAFVKDLRGVINKHSRENGSNTPDFILAKYLFDCLTAFNETSRAREKWFGKELRIGGSVEICPQCNEANRVENKSW